MSISKNQKQIRLPNEPAMIDSGFSDTNEIDEENERSTDDD